MKNMINSLHHLNAWEPQAATGSSLVTASGIAVLDDMLPGGGWPKRGLVEIILPDPYSNPMSLLLPALIRLSQQGRWIALVNPTYPARSGLLKEAAINHDRLLQVNPHPGRSALWTAESMLYSGDCSVVMAWPNCNTELMGKRLQKAAARGKALGILFRYEGLGTQPSGVETRLKLEVDAQGRAVYLLNSKGETLAGAAL
jgi:cell division inhibitor SulA